MQAFVDRRYWLLAVLPKLVDPAIQLVDKVEREVVLVLFHLLNRKSAGETDIVVPNEYDLAIGRMQKQVKRFCRAQAAEAKRDVLSLVHRQSEYGTWDPAYVSSMQCKYVNVSCQMFQKCLFDTIAMHPQVSLHAWICSIHPCLCCFHIDIAYTSFKWLCLVIELNAFSYNVMPYSYTNCPFSCLSPESHSCPLKFRHFHQRRQCCLTQENEVLAKAKKQKAKKDIRDIGRVVGQQALHSALKIGESGLKAALAAHGIGCEGCFTAVCHDGFPAAVFMWHALAAKLHSHVDFTKQKAELQIELCLHQYLLLVHSPMIAMINLV